MHDHRRLPVGAEPGPHGTAFRVWAPAHERLAVVLDDGPTHPLQRSADGYFEGVVAAARAGMRYRLRTQDGALLPDPASRFQPEGPHGASLIVDPDAFAWSDSVWTGPPDGRQIIYEMHIGTFSPEGTWSGARRHLRELAELGITLIEVMPVAEFAGTRNWGYDGVAPFAPTRAYGEPDDMRKFVDAAHALGIGVVLDVVYNHLGPDGNYLASLAPTYFSETYTTDWGEAVNFDGRGSGPVREFFLANVAYWIREFHLDGLRFDATQNIYDASEPHILDEMTALVRSAAAPRRTFTVSENEPQDARMIRPRSAGGHGMDAVWNDDFHHTAMVALTGVREAYYTDYGGTPQELISCARHGFLYQGQYYAWQEQPRGTPTLHLGGSPFVNFIQNHDQIANSDAGRRIHELTGPAELRALTALMILMPGHTMLFQGQEFASSSRFLFFADHKPELSAEVYEGRREFLRQFRSTAMPRMQERIDDPAARRTFDVCVLDHAERAANAHVVALHRDLIRLARTDPVLALNERAAVDGCVLGDHAFALRFPGTADDDRLLIVNLGSDLRLEIAPHPLLAPPYRAQWRTLLTTEHPQYGGRGGPDPETAGGWAIVARSAVLLAAVHPPGARDGT
jgi:maltooligosyltrehalose trehalohydrolase